MALLSDGYIIYFDDGVCQLEMDFSWLCRGLRVNAKAPDINWSGAY